MTINIFSSVLFLTLSPSHKVLLLPIEDRLGDKTSDFITGLIFFVPYLAKRDLQMTYTNISRNIVTVHRDFISNSVSFYNSICTKK